MKPERIVAANILKRIVTETIERLWPLTADHRARIAEMIVARMSLPCYREVLRDFAKSDE